MKIAISSSSGKLDRPFSPRFGRCEFFLLVDPEISDWESVSNPAVDARGGAGAQVVQFLSDQGVQAVISGRFGPNAFSALQAAGIKAYQASNATPEELAEQFLAGKLEEVHAASGRGMH